MDDAKTPVAQQTDIDFITAHDNQNKQNGGGAKAHLPPFLGMWCPRQKGEEGEEPAKETGLRPEARPV